MAPLSYVALYLMSGGKATWFTESLAIVIAQGLLVLTMYAGLSLCLDRPLPFLAAFCSVPVYYALTKTVFFDAWTQLVVAAVAVLASLFPRLMHRRAQEVGIAGLAAQSRLRNAALLALLAVCSVAAVLSKQSTGIGCFLGAVLVVGALVDYPTSAARLGSLATFLVLATVAFAGASLSMSPWLSVPGMLNDVFRTGSEPKGGLGLMISHLVGFSAEIASCLILLAVFGAAFAATLGRSWRSGAARNTDEPSVDARISEVRNWPGIYLCALAGPLLLLFPDVLPEEVRRYAKSQSEALRWAILWSGLFVAAFEVLRIRKSVAVEAPSYRHDHRALAAMFCVLLPAAAFHSLSGISFRWTYDNNPLITLAISGTLVSLLHVSSHVSRDRPGQGRRFWGGVIALVCCACWARFSEPLRECRQCARECSDIPYLRHARLPPGAESVRTLASVVKDCVLDDPNARVLLLPNDPDVEEWIGCARPKLSCAVLFADHYWDRYVESDFDRLARDPPKVIVMGPRKGWREFAEHWHKNWGCTRLIEGVRTRLLPRSYAHYRAIPLTFNGKDDWIDVFKKR
jgi:hypothetical protein